MRITVAHSPDSDDAFMFYGLASGAVPTGDLEVEQVLADIESLNRWAFEGKYEVTAVSFHAFAHLSDRYALLPHGASMGDGYGPMVVAREDGPTSLEGVTVAIPGTLTSAWLVLQMYAPGIAHVVMPFDESSRRWPMAAWRPACSSTRASSPTATTGCGWSSTSACGGASGPAGCRCR